jgi:hypothetical protein
MLPLITTRTFGSIELKVVLLSQDLSISLIKLSELHKPVIPATWEARP